MKPHCSAVGKPCRGCKQWSLTQASFGFPAAMHDALVSSFPILSCHRGMSSTSFYSSMPNTNKAMYQVRVLGRFDMKIDR